MRGFENEGKAPRRILVGPRTIAWRPSDLLAWIAQRAAVEDTPESLIMVMNNPPHPGLSVKHDCLEPLGLTVTKAAEVLGVTRQTLNDLVHCRRGISPEMAIRLDLAFGGGAETWVRLQAAYDLAQARKHADRIRVTRYARQDA